MILQKICIVPVLRSSRDRTRRFEAFFFAHNLFFVDFSLFSTVFKSSFRFPISSFFYFLNNFRALEKVLKNDFLLFFWNSLLYSARSGSEQFSLLFFLQKNMEWIFCGKITCAARKRAHNGSADGQAEFGRSKICLWNWIFYPRSANSKIFRIFAQSSLSGDYPEIK